MNNALGIFKEVLFDEKDKRNYRAADNQHIRWC